MLFANRKDAGQRLARKLGWLRGRSDLIVLGLPRGGVAVAYEVAHALQAPLDVLVVRRIAEPGRDGVKGESEALARWEQLYRGDRPPLDVQERTVLVVDEGLASSSIMRPAVGALRRAGAAHIIVALPVAAASSWSELRAEVDELVCVHWREPFLAVGAWYGDFHQISDEEVRRLLERSRQEQGEAAEASRQA